MEELKFSLVRKEVKVVLEDADGVASTYRMREMTGKDRDAYLTNMSDKMEFNEEGKIKTLKDFNGLESSLLVLTLFKEDGTSLTEEVIQGFPASVVSKLFTKSQEINALDEKSAKKVKNESKVKD